MSEADVIRRPPGIETLFQGGVSPTDASPRDPPSSPFWKQVNAP